MKQHPRLPGTQATDAQWMQWADDEAAAPAGEGSAARGEVVGRVVADLGQVVRSHYDAAADKNDEAVAGLWTSIASDIAKAPHAAAPAVSVSPAVSVPSASVVGWWRYAATGICSAAVASLVTFAISRQGAAPTVATSPTQLPVAAPVIPMSPVSPPSAMLVPAMYRQPPTVETLDVAGGSGTVITVEDPEGNAAIIWVTPNDLGESL